MQVLGLQLLLLRRYQAKCYMNGQNTFINKYILKMFSKSSFRFVRKLLFYLLLIHISLWASSILIPIITLVHQNVRTKEVTKCPQSLVTVLPVLNIRVMILNLN